MGSASTAHLQAQSPLQRLAGGDSEPCRCGTGARGPEPRPRAAITRLQRGAGPQGAAPGNGGGRWERKVQTAPNATPKPSEEAAARHAWHRVAGVSGRGPAGQEPARGGQPAGAPGSAEGNSPGSSQEGGVSDLLRLSHLQSMEAGSGWGKGRQGSGKGKAEGSGLGRKSPSRDGGDGEGVGMGSEAKGPALKDRK